MKDDGDAVQERLATAERHSELVLRLERDNHEAKIKQMGERLGEAQREARQVVWEKVKKHIENMKLANRSLALPEPDPDNLRDQMLAIDSELRRLEFWCRAQAAKEGA